MELRELCAELDKLFYCYMDGFKTVQSKQKELLNILGPETDISKITDDVIIQYVLILRQNGNKPRTIISKLAYLKRILKYAYNTGKIPRYPFFPSVSVRQGKKDKNINENIFASMLQWAEADKEFRNILLIGYYTGLRINSILSFNPDEDLAGDFVKIYDEKTDTNFLLPIHSKIKDVVKTFKATYNYNAVYYIFEKMKKALDLPKNITIHSLRHTFITDLNKKGVPLPVIQKLANHKKITTTMGYCSIDTDTLLSAVNTL